jgi:Zn-finger nucleic acid-binding protein
MRQYERSGVVVDQCTECRGIFLDRGELEKLVDAETAYHAPAAAAAPPPPQYQQQPAQYQQPYRKYDSDDYPRYGQGHGYPPKKRKSFLGELFD